MRSDLNKQLCERQRHGSSSDYSEVRHDTQFEKIYTTHDDGAYTDDYTASFVTSGCRESMTSRYARHWNRKQLNENLNPLFGIVRKNVGRPWNKIYSELCSVFDARSVINQHILQHLNQYVEQENVIFVDGELRFRQKYSGINYGLKDGYVEYYVDPRDGILKHNKWYKSYKHSQRMLKNQRDIEALKIKRVIDDSTELHKIEDIWFEVKFLDQQGTSQVTNSLNVNPAPSAHSLVYPPTFDILLKTNSHAKRVAVSKRTLSKKELKHYKLA